MLRSDRNPDIELFWQGIVFSGMCSQPFTGAGLRQPEPEPEPEPEAEPESERYRPMHP